MLTSIFQTVNLVNPEAPVGRLRLGGYCARARLPWPDPTGVEAEVVFFDETIPVSVCMC